MDAQQEQDLESRALGVSLGSTPQEVSAAVTATGSGNQVDVAINAISKRPCSLLGVKSEPSPDRSEPVSSEPREVAHQAPDVD